MEAVSSSRGRIRIDEPWMIHLDIHLPAPCWLATNCIALLKGCTVLVVLVARTVCAVEADPRGKNLEWSPILRCLPNLPPLRNWVTWPWNHITYLRARRYDTDYHRMYEIVTLHLLSVLFLSLPPSSSSSLSPWSIPRSPVKSWNEYLQAVLIRLSSGNQQLSYSYICNGTNMPYHI